jgi:hypothetical protein
VMDSRDLTNRISVSEAINIRDKVYLRLSFFKSSFICSNCCAVTLAFANYIECYLSVNSFS